MRSRLPETDEYRRIVELFEAHLPLQREESGRR